VPTVAKDGRVFSVSLVVAVVADVVVAETVLIQYSTRHIFRTLMVC